jgi:hypothetical protein
MEIVLQWLDELDDLIFAGVALWQRLSQLCLRVALVASLGLVAVSRFDATRLELVILGAFALAALTTSLLFGLIARTAGNSRHSMSSSA